MAASELLTDTPADTQIPGADQTSENQTDAFISVRDDRIPDLMDDRH